MDGGGGGFIMLFSFIKLLGLCTICIKIVLKGGSGVLPQIIFTELGTKLGNSSHFLTRRMTYTTECCHNKRVDGIYVICII